MGKIFFVTFLGCFLLELRKFMNDNLFIERKEMLTTVRIFNVKVEEFLQIQESRDQLSINLLN